jgi:hypothetical protein
VETKNVKYSFLLVLVVIDSYGIYSAGSKMNFGIFKNYDYKYRKEIKQAFANSNVSGDFVGIRFMDQEYYENIYQIQSTDQFEGFPFAFLTDKLHLFTLNTDAIPLPSEKDDVFGIYEFSFSIYRNLEYFTYYANENGLNIDSEKELFQCQIKFIKDFNVNFVVVQKGAEIPDEIRYLSNDSINSTENGETIYFLNNFHKK